MASSLYTIYSLSRNRQNRIRNTDWIMLLFFLHLQSENVFVYLILTDTVAFTRKSWRYLIWFTILQLLIQYILGSIINVHSQFVEFTTNRAIYSLEEIFWNLYQLIIYNSKILIYTSDWLSALTKYSNRSFSSKLRFLIAVETIIFYFIF